MRLLPPLAVAYLLAFLDRGNVGNAKVAGMLQTIPMSDALYNTGEPCDTLTVASQEADMSVHLHRSGRILCVIRLV